MTDSNSPAEWISRNWEEISELRAVARPVQPCFVVACDRGVFSGGLCKTHYQLARRKFGPGSPAAAKRADR